MGDIINLDEHRPGEWLSGMMTCLVCGYRNVAVAMAGHDFWECPNCHLEFAVYAPVMPDTMWVCGCGNKLFAVSPDGYHCVRCGVKQEGF